MGYLVKVNLNDLPWKDDNVRRTCLRELEHLALDSRGYRTAWQQYVAYGHHLIVLFEDQESAFDYMKLLIDKPYFGRVSIEDSQMQTRIRTDVLPQEPGHLRFGDLPPDYAPRGLRTSE